ncbi:leupeptin-inactivating enzyme 1 precursor [Aaosphaeria arxii CBS 175.79]|uniref:Peptide hydrolase n=1 Tax=Aaosphaeria arxii CBS 175.79 TaxID=1450172 RepID=A0A6A5Y9X2_9PLEO|nr:leupeptin-inactivating enzyme 1 precursor [Aaosphaeria arxii CBS 175.79]KAF2021610.1 leupeptin-inactivating enzyme 1 precursor [Aaosphaeria arxii CBS 175.79]
MKSQLASGLILAGAAQSIAGALPETNKNYKPLVESKALQRLVTTEGLWGNLEKLDEIAKANGNNRAFGLPGYAASVDYILSRTKDSPDFNTYTQDFPANFSQVTSISFKVDDNDYYVIGLTYSPSTTEEGLTAKLALGVPGDAGCTEQAYADLDVKDKIVLVQRGACPDGTTLAGRMKPAAAAGAAAVVIYNDVETQVTAGTLSSPNPQYVPTGFINRDDGEELVARLENGEDIEAYFQQSQTIETRITQNVITETKGGDPNNVVILGAHLDSVQAGAGINDDGSGTSLILEIKTALEKFRVKNKVRFIWWGAEENGLLGSKFYTNNLNVTAANSILAYLNFDMVSRGYFGVFDGDGSTYNLSGPAGSDVIERIFVEDLTSKGINVTAARFTGGSDYQSFINIGKPVGGLHTGTGVAQDPCYHQACDTIENPDANTITVNAKTAAHVLSILATKGHQIIPKSPVNATVSSRGLIGRNAVTWTLGEDERHLGTCEHVI